MKNNATHILRYGTVAERTHLEKAVNSYDILGINGNTAAYVPSAIATFIINNYLGRKDKGFFVDPITYAFQKEIHLLKRKSKKTGESSIKKSINNLIEYYKEPVTKVLNLLLLFLYSEGNTNSINEAIIGRTRLMKMMFLFEEEVKKAFFEDVNIVNLPIFEPYLYGPYSKSVFDDLRIFISIGLIKEEITSIPTSAIEKIEAEDFYDTDEDDDWGDASFSDGDFYSDENWEKKYALTENGMKYVSDNIWESLSKNQKETLKLFKAKINTISLDSLLKYVYNKYPKYTEKSVIAGKHLK